MAGIVGNILKSEIRREMRRKTEQILKSVRRVEKSQNELVHAIDRWISFMERVLEELK